MLLNKIDDKSPSSITTALDLFRYPPTNVSLSKSYYKEIGLLNPITDPPYIIKIPPISSFADFKHMYLRTEWKLTKSVNNAPEINLLDSDKVSVIQGFGANFIKSLRVLLGGKEIYTSNGLYSYINYIDTELSYSQEAKNTHLAVTGYYPDGFDMNLAAGEGFKKRSRLFTEGKTVEFITRLNVDLFNTDKYFINNTDIEIEIIPHDALFLLMAPNLPNNTKLILKITNMKLHVLFHDVIDGLALSIAEKLNHPNETVKYPLRSVEAKMVYIEAGRTYMDINLFTGKIPRKLIVCMTPRVNSDGSLAVSPFEFKHFSTKTMRVFWNGLENPNIAYSFDYSTDRYVRAYFDMMQATGYAFTPFSNGITLEKYRQGWNFYVFNLTANLEDDKSCELIRFGTTSLHATFDDQIPTGGVSMIVIAEYDTLMKLDNYRNVTTDLTV